MVSVTYSGDLGNRLFQHCVGIALAECLNYEFEASGLRDFPATTHQRKGRKVYWPKHFVSGQELESLFNGGSASEQSAICLYGDLCNVDFAILRSSSCIEWVLGNRCPAEERHLGVSVGFGTPPGDCAPSLNYVELESVVNSAGANHLSVAINDAQAWESEFNELGPTTLHTRPTAATVFEMLKCDTLIVGSSPLDLMIASLGGAKKVYYQTDQLDCCPSYQPYRCPPNLLQSEFKYAKEWIPTSAIQ